MNEGDPKEDARNLAWEKDIALSRLRSSLVGPTIAMGMSTELIEEIEEFLIYEGPRSPEELEKIITRLDVASAINNDPKAREIRADLLRIYGK